MSLAKPGLSSSFPVIPQVTLSRYLVEEQIRLHLGQDELVSVIGNIQTIAKTISSTLRRNDPPQITPVKADCALRSFGSENIQHQSISYHQHSYNRRACSLSSQSNDGKMETNTFNEVFINTLRASRGVSMLISHNNTTPIQANFNKEGKYVICFVGLDNTRNIECNLPAGSLFVIFKKHSNHGAVTPEDALQPGKNAIAAGYIMYGAATIIVMSIGQGVHGFTLDNAIGEFLLTDPDIHIPLKGNVYSVNEGYMYQWDSMVAEYVETKKSYKIGRPYRAQFVDSLTSDAHRTLRHGGLYLSPCIKGCPQGQLGLLYECIPVAYLMVQAGGLATTGKTPILDIIPDQIHQKSPIYLGSREDVREILSIHKRKSLK